MEETNAVSSSSNPTAKKKANSKDGVFSKIADLFSGVKAEFGKIIWPT